MQSSGCSRHRVRYGVMHGQLQVPPVDAAAAAAAADDVRLETKQAAAVNLDGGAGVAAAAAAAAGGDDDHDPVNILLMNDAPLSPDAIARAAVTALLAQRIRYSSSIVSCMATLNLLRWVLMSAGRADIAAFIPVTYASACAMMAPLRPPLQRIHACSNDCGFCFVDEYASASKCMQPACGGVRYTAYGGAMREFFYFPLIKRLEQSFSVSNWAAALRYPWQRTIEPGILNDVWDGTIARQMLHDYVRPDELPILVSLCNDCANMDRHDHLKIEPHTLTILNFHPFIRQDARLRLVTTVCPPHVPRDLVHHYSARMIDELLLLANGVEMFDSSLRRKVGHGLLGL